MKDATDAIKADLDAASLGMSFRYPNVKSDLDPPFAEVFFSGGEAFGETLKGGEVERVNFVCEVLVKTDLLGGEGAAYSLADGVKDLFPTGYRKAITGGIVTASRETTVRTGFQDGNHWAVPVIARFNATST